MSNKIIKISRGDSYEFTVKITQRNNIDPYILDSEKDAVYFAILLPHQAFEDADPERQVKGYDASEQDQVFNKLTGEPTETTGNITIKIEPNDTRCLAPGIYYYTVKLQRGGTLSIINDLDTPDEVRTIIDRTKFIIYD